MENKFREKVNNELYKFLDDFSQRVPFANHLGKDKQINKKYFIRHQIEIILRIRLRRAIDALTIHYFTKHDPKLAKKWANYTDDEMLHDKMFIHDLESLGACENDVDSAEPLFATKLLQGYFYYGLEHEGRPLASVVSSYLLEYLSTIVLPQWNKNTGDVLGEAAVKGASAHVDHDLEVSHVNLIWSVLIELVHNEGDEKLVLEHLRNVYKLLCMFYEELYANIIKKIDPQEFNFGDYIVRR